MRRAPCLSSSSSSGGLRALATRRFALDRQAARLRPLHQLGAGAAAGRDDQGPGSRARGPARPGLSGRRPRRAHPGRAQPGRRPGPGRADRPRPPVDRAHGRGDRLQQLGGRALTLRHRRAPDRRRPAPSPEHAGSGLSARPLPRRALLSWRLAPGDPGRGIRAEQRRRLDLHQRDGRRHGPLLRAPRRHLLRVRGCRAPAHRPRRGDRRQGAVAGEAGRARDASRADRQRGAAGRRRRAPRARLVGAALALLLRRQSACARLRRAGPTRSRAWPTCTLPSPTWSGRIATAPSATRRWAACRCAAATARTCRSPAGAASSSGRGGWPTASSPRSPTPRRAIW